MVAAKALSFVEVQVHADDQGRPRLAVYDLVHRLRFSGSVGVSHARVAGHIILVIGYENYHPAVSSAAFNLVVHDSYGRFDPNLLSKLYGGNRYTGGACLPRGGET